MAFDIDDIQQNDTAEIQILHPETGEEIGVVATVYGEDSEVFRKASYKEESRYLEYGKRNRNKIMPPDLRAGVVKDKAIACTKSITGLTKGGVPLTDIEEIFTLRPWIYRQVQAGIMDNANFTKGSSAK